MQVPASITLTNGNSPHSSRHNYSAPPPPRSINTYFDNAPFGMEVPEKLTGSFLIKTHLSAAQYLL
jgi:hypothetical protein